MLLLGEFQTSVRKALDEVDSDWKEYEGLVVCGTHAPKDVEMIIDEIKRARESDTPFLGICAGLQFMAIEIARNIFGIKDATSEEFSRQGTFVVRKIPSLEVGIREVKSEYGVTMESFWHNYEVDPKYFHEKSVPVDVMTLGSLRHFVGVQFHPEYQSSKQRPHPILVKFLHACSV